MALEDREWYQKEVDQRKAGRPSAPKQPTPQAGPLPPSEQPSIVVGGVRVFTGLGSDLPGNPSSRPAPSSRPPLLFWSVVTVLIFLLAVIGWVLAHRA